MTSLALLRASGTRLASLASIAGVVVPMLAVAACNPSSDYMRHAAPLSAPTSADAQIVFVRDSALGSAVILTIIDDKGRFIGESTAHSHFAVALPPGSYTFIAWGEGTHAMRANVAAGKRYYVEVDPNIGAFSARFHLLAVKPNTPRWRSVQASVAGTEPLAPIQDRGQAYADGRAQAREDAIRKGLARMAAYTPAELAERSLEEGDGQ